MKKTALILSLAVMLSAVSCSDVSDGTSGISDSSSLSASTTESGVKTSITIAIAESPDSWLGWQRVWKKAEKMNSGSGPYSVEIKHYEFDEDDNTGDSSVSRLSMDILAGKAPDIISASPFQLDKFRKNGYLADIGALMDSGTGLNREDFLDNVIDSVEQDGKISVIYPAFTIYTAAAKTSLVGDTGNWTMHQAMDACNDFGGDFLADMYTKYDMRHYFFHGIMIDCIDFRGHTCDFSTELPEVIDFLDSVPVMEKRFGDSTAVIGQIHDNTALVKEMWIPGISYYYADEILRNFADEPFTFVGYPTNSGSGTYASVPSAFGIMANSKHKDEAWVVLSELFFGTTFQTEISDNAYGIPVRKNVVENLLSLDADAGQPSESEEETSPKKPMPTSIRAPVELPDGTQMRLSDAQIKQLSDFITSLEIDPFVSPNMEWMIKEESDYVFEGERSAEQCADILQNRIGLYLSETQ